MKVDRKKVLLLRYQINKFLRERDKRLVVLYKDEEWTVTWWLLVIKWFVDFVGLFSKSFKRRWYENFSNGIYNYIIFPSRRRYGDWSQPHVYKIVRHEFVHIKQSFKWPLWFPTSYIAVLPALLSMRAYWEFPAYAETIRAHSELGGKLTDEYLELFVGYFTGQSYFWMFPFPGFIRKKLHKLRDEIESGKK